MPRYPSTYDATPSSRSVVKAFLNQVYGWMACGLLLTAFVAFYIFNSPALLDTIRSNSTLLFVLIIAQLGVVIGLSAAISRLSASTATTLFMLYAALTGVTLSLLFAIYTPVSIASTFFITAGMFAAMSLYGLNTKKDLSSWGNMLFMGLIGIILATLVNLFLQNSTLYWLISYVGVVLFVGLTAYDTQKLKMMATQIDGDNAVMVRKVAIMGALTLYLDFINLFIMLLRIFGDRR